MNESLYRSSSREKYIPFVETSKTHLIALSENDVKVIYGMSSSGYLKVVSFVSEPYH